MKKLILATLIATGIGAPALCMDPVVEKEIVGTIISNRNIRKLSEMPLEDIALYYQTADIKKDIEFLVEWARGFKYKEPQLLDIMNSIPSLLDVAIEVGGTDAASPSYQYNLGMFLLCEIHATKYTKEGFNFIKIAADKGIGLAQYDLAHFYTFGKIVEKNEQEAFRYAKLAYNQKVYPIKPLLIDKYENGSGVEQDILMAIGLTDDFRDKSMMKKYLELVRDSAAGLAHEELLIEVQLPVLTKILIKKMSLKANLHTPSRFRKDNQHLAIPELGLRYSALAEYGSKISFMGERILQNLSTGGFCISCLQPTKLLKSNYKVDSEGEKTMFCMFVTDGAFYSFVGKPNAPIGYKLKQLLGQEKDEAFKNLDLLENNLCVAKSTALSLLSMYNIGDGANTPQIKQLDEELALISAVRESIKKSIDFIHDLLRYNLKDRNSLFIEVYYKNVINKGE